MELSTIILITIVVLLVFGIAKVLFYMWGRYTIKGAKYNLKNRDTKKRILAIEYLSTKKEIDSIFSMLRDKNRNVRETARISLYSNEVPNELMLEKYFSILSFSLSPKEARIEILQELKKQDKNICERLIDNINLEDLDIYELTISVLEKFQAKENLMEKLHLKALNSYSVKLDALKYLVSYQTENVITTLNKKLKQRDSNIPWDEKIPKVEVAKTLALIGEKEGTFYLFNQMRHYNKVDAVRALQEVGISNDEIFSHLLEKTNYKTDKDLNQSVIELAKRATTNFGTEGLVKCLIATDSDKVSLLKEVMLKLESELNKIERKHRLISCLSKALEFRVEGYDFDVEFSPEEGHRENEWGDPDFEYSIHPENNPHGPMGGFDWVVDVPEKLEIKRGEKLK